MDSNINPVGIVAAPLVWMYAAMLGTLVVAAGYFALLAVAYVLGAATGNLGPAPDPNQPMTVAEHQRRQDGAPAGYLLAAMLVAAGVWTFIAVCNRAGAPLPGTF